jgi:Carbamoyltransferase C-terminus
MPSPPRWCVTWKLFPSSRKNAPPAKKMIPTSRVTPSNFVSIIVRRERVQDYFELDAESPYMLLVAPVKKELRREVSPDVKGFDRLKEIRSTLPAITHVDYSVRIQTMEPQGNPLLYDLLLRGSSRRPAAACW